MPKIKFFSRCYQKIMKVACYLIKWPKPSIIEGREASLEIPNVIQQYGLTKPFIIINPYLYETNVFVDVLKKFTDLKINYVINADVASEPTIIIVEELLSKYQSEKCDSIIAVGGGSVIDAAKLLGARINNSNKTINQMKGVLKVKKRIPFTIAVPTTAGSGSECTIAAVIKDTENHTKYAVNSPTLVPNVAVLDPKFTVTLPIQLTLTTGMDALTHAIECYIGGSNTKTTYADSMKAVKLIFESLEELLEKPSDLKLRLKMQKAAYLAGAAFTRGYVGYVHSIAHALGAYYNIPHGEANAVILPLVLDKYKNKINKKMINLATYLQIGCNLPDNEKIELLYNKIESLASSVKKSNGFTKINENDYESLIKHIQSETWPLYPVPMYLDSYDLIDIFEKIKENA